MNQFLIIAVSDYTVPFIYYNDKGYSCFLIYLHQIIAETVLIIEFGPKYNPKIFIYILDNPCKNPKTKQHPSVLHYTYSYASYNLHLRQAWYLQRAP